MHPCLIRWITGLVVSLAAASGQAAPPTPLVDVTILSPAPQDRVAGDYVMVRGTFRGPANTGVVVNGVATLTDGQYFYANNVPLKHGGNILEAVATTPSGAKAQSRVLVHVSGDPRLRLVATPDRGLGSLSTTFTLMPETGRAQRISVDFDGDGVADVVGTDPTAPLRFTYASPGVYAARATVTDATGATYDTTFAVQVLDGIAHDLMLRAIFSNMNAALVQGDVERALQGVALLSRDRYDAVFRALRGRFPAIVASYSPLQPTIVAATFGEYALNRTIRGQEMLFFIYFIQDEDGVWRIESM